MSTQLDNEDLEHLAPNLARIPKMDPFHMEEGFFERFPHQVQALVAHEKRGAWPSVWVGRAAFTLPLIALLIGGWWFFRPLPQLPPADQVATTESLSTAELYMLEEDGLLADLAPEELPEHAASSEAPALEADELAAYYELTGTDLTDLIENL